MNSTKKVKLRTPKEACLDGKSLVSSTRTSVSQRAAQPLGYALYLDFRATTCYHSSSADNP